MHHNPHPEYKQRAYEPWKAPVVQESARFARNEPIERYTPWYVEVSTEQHQNAPITS
jgi:hypothetical protein